ncbi:MAG: hypothetical protein AAF586_01365 [Planctomycetota bacterium]
MEPATPTPDVLNSFHPVDGLVIVGYLAVVSVLGVALAGRQRSMEDFFRGGDRLPWYAVSASLIATIVSAVTFIGVPAVAFREGGNFTYLQFGIVAGLLSRIVVAFVLVPAYYRHRVYSPYDFMGRRLGESARAVTTALFSLLGLLAQSARVYLTAVVLSLMLAGPLSSLERATGIDAFAWAVIMIGAVAVAWTLLGGIATVVWTDTMLLIVFVLGGLVALGVIAVELSGGLFAGLSEIIVSGAEAGKFKLWSLGASTDRWSAFLTDPYTVWAAIFAVTFGNIGQYGTDQLLAQRIFCCRGRRSAQAAILSSWAGELVAALMLLVGVGLWAFYRAHPERLAIGDVANNPDNVFPIFILTQVPVGLRGLILAGVFAAAVSSLTSIIAALAQTTLSATYLPWRSRRGGTARATPAELLRVSRLLIVMWSVLLCAAAFVVRFYVDSSREAGEDVPLLDLALGLASYVVGALLAAFLLAWLPLRISGYGLIWSAPLSVISVYASRSHDPGLPDSLQAYLTGWSTSHGFLTLMLACGLLLMLTWVLSACLGPRSMRGARLARTPWAMLGAAWIVWLSTQGYFPGEIDPITGTPAQLSVAWPWYAPLGGLTAIVFGYLLADRRERRPVRDETESAD